MTLYIPKPVTTTARQTEEGRRWLSDLPRTVEKTRATWQLRLGRPFEHDASCSWVAPVEMADGTPAVLKIGLPHMEGTDEAAGLAFWDGDPTVRLLAADAGANAMLLERCVPGTSLRQLPEDEQDVVVAQLLRELWSKSVAGLPSTVPITDEASGGSRGPTDHQRVRFRPLSLMLAHWESETRQDENHWPDWGLVEAGLRLFRELSTDATDTVLLATDLHAGNVLRAERRPWLVVDPKPFVGDPAYDATQHLFNCRARLYADPDGTIRRFADLLEVPWERVRLWTFARTAAAPRDKWDDADLQRFARAIAP